MKVINVNSRTVKTYTLDIWNGEIRPVPYSRGDRTYRVTRVQVEKVDGNFRKPELRGPVLKKDGTDSVNQAKERVWSDPPQWLLDAIKGLA